MIEASDSPLFCCISLHGFCTACRPELRFEPAGRAFVLRFALLWKMSRVATRAGFTAPCAGVEAVEDVWIRADPQSQCMRGLPAKRCLSREEGSGIGAAFTQAFAGQGARVGFVDIAEEAAERWPPRFRKRRERRPCFIACDIRDIAGMQAAIEKIHLGLGDIGVLVNNAGNDDRHTRIKSRLPTGMSGISVNVRHMFFAAQAVAPQMKRLGGGAIINLGSIIWRLKQTGLPVYNVTRLPSLD